METIALSAICLKNGAWISIRNEMEAFDRSWGSWDWLQPKNWRVFRKRRNVRLWLSKVSPEQINFWIEIHSNTNLNRNPDYKGSFGSIWFFQSILILRASSLHVIRAAQDERRFLFSHHHWTQRCAITKWVLRRCPNSEDLGEVVSTEPVAQTRSEQWKRVEANWRRPQMKNSRKVSAAESQSELPGTPQNPFGRSPERVENPMNRRPSDAKWQLLCSSGGALVTEHTTWEVTRDRKESFPGFARILLFTIFPGFLKPRLWMLFTALCSQFILLFEKYAVITTEKTSFDVI